MQSSKPNTLALLGGAFNPVHFGHLAIAEAAHLELGYTLILFIPSSIPAHKEADLDTPPADRVAMTELAVSDIDYICVETCEIERGGVSYTIDTLDYIKSNYDFEGKPGLIIGDDLVEGFHTWKDAGAVAGQVDLIIARRDTGRKKELEFEHQYLNNQVIDAASSDIREMVRNGDSIDGYVPESVKRYIDQHKLYR